MQETRVWSLGREDPLEKEMATRYSPWGHRESGMTERLHFIPASSNHQPSQSAAINNQSQTLCQQDDDLLKTQMMVSIF